MALIADAGGALAWAVGRGGLAACPFKKIKTASRRSLATGYVTRSRGSSRLPFPAPADHTENAEPASKQRERGGQRGCYRTWQVNCEEIRPRKPRRPR